MLGLLFAAGVLGSALIGLNMSDVETEELPQDDPIMKDNLLTEAGKPAIEPIIAICLLDETDDKETEPAGEETVTLEDQTPDMQDEMNKVAIQSEPDQENSSLSEDETEVDEGAEDSEDSEVTIVQAQKPSQDNWTVSQFWAQQTA